MTEKKKKKIALINQRYGLEVNGGSEYYTRQLAEHLLKEYEVEILTTKALGYDTWEDYYSDDVEMIHGIKVRRFHVAKHRNPLEMKILERIRRYCPLIRSFCEERWMDAQGPYSPELISYIEQHAEEYEVFIFVTYLYYQTVRGIKKVSDKAILIPTAHDEPYIYFDIFKCVFTAPSGLVYLTPEEKHFVESVFPVAQKPNCVCGAGVDVPEKVDANTFRKKYSVTDDYFIYVGRIDESKGCKDMLRIFQEYKRQYPNRKEKLILIGKAAMTLPDQPEILPLGFVSEEDKFNAISGAAALWLPSKYESLSIAVLEALSLGVPVVVNGACEVLKGHCERSGAGIYYRSEQEAVTRLNEIMQIENRMEISEKARKYVKENYQWNIVINKIESLIKE